MARISVSTDYAVFADMRPRHRGQRPRKRTIKRAIYKTLVPHLKPSRCMMASNTSSISHHAAGRQHRAAGKVHRHALHESGSGHEAGGSDPWHRHRRGRRFRRRQALARVKARIRPSRRSAEDFPAFIVNRILVPMINEAVYALYEGVASVAGIDTALKLGASHRMGPLELADFIGLDTCLSIMQVLYEGLSDSKYRPCPLLVKYVEAGWLGRKTGRGFYDYSQTPPKPTR